MFIQKFMEVYGIYWKPYKERTYVCTTYIQSGELYVHLVEKGGRFRFPWRLVVFPGFCEEIKSTPDDDFWSNI